MIDSVNNRARSKVMAGAFVFVALAVLAVISIAALSLRTPHVSFDRNGLRISNSLFGRTIPLDELDLSHARLVDFKNSPELSPRLRTFGIGLFRYQSGWYRLRNGSKALLFLTRSDRILYLQTREDYQVLISPDNPNLVLEILNKSAR